MLKRLNIIITVGLEAYSGGLNKDWCTVYVKQKPTL